MTAPNTNTSILVRVQARGGKYLGPGVKNAMVTVLSGGNVIFGPALAGGGSGTVDTTTGAPIPHAASRDVIVVQPTSSGPPAGAYWLLPSDPPPTAGVVAKFHLTAPALLEFRATALYDTPNPVIASAMMWVLPGMHLTNEPGLLISVPGLVVTLSPPTIGTELSITATVTMMCGCPITAPAWPFVSGAPEPYWPEPEFQVLAVLTNPSGLSTTKAMTFTTTNTFTASFPLPPSGTSTIAVHAVQPAEANVGFGEAVVSC